MKVSIISFSLLFCSAYSAFSVPCQFEDGSFGKCVDIGSCRSLLTPFTQKLIKIEDIQICDSARRLVCCPRISDRKCKEYGRYAVEVARLPSLILNSEVREIVIRTKCTHKPTSLIVGGEEAKLHEFPHQALLGYQDNDTVKWLCGASLISPDFVLTAAHCINVPDYGSVKYVKLGMNDRNYDGAKAVLLTVKKTFKHPRGVLSSYHNDIALIELQSSVKIDEFILPVCLPTRPYNNDKAFVTGFGETGKGKQSQKLLKVVLEKFDQQVCKDSIEQKFNENTMLCYGHHTERKDACSGDSGGPLQVSNHDQVNCTFVQFGIISLGPNYCGVIGGPGAYINVYKFLDWIEEIVWKDEV